MISGKGAWTIVCVLVLAFLGLAIARDLQAKIYYVDPVDGNDSNTGLAQTQAWRNIPGTYKADNSGPLTPSGWVRISAGDVIKIRSGTTIGNRLVVNWSWYNNGTAEAPIVITRDVSWDAGPVIFDGSAQIFGEWDPMIFAWARDYIQIDGASEHGIVIQNANGIGFQATGTSESSKMAGLIVKNVKLYNNVKFNFMVQRNDSFYLEKVDVDGNHQNGVYAGGFIIGDNTYGCSNGRVINCKSYNHGDVPGANAGWTNAWIGFWVTNSTAITLQDCVAYDNKGAGYDVGIVGSPPSTVTDNIKYINCESYNNASGFSGSLEDISGTSRSWYINCVARHNGAGWMIYNGATAYIYNCLTTDNGWGMYLDAPAYRNREMVVQIKNTIFFKNSRPGYGTYPWDLWTHRVSGLKLTMDYNHFEQGEQSTCIDWNGVEVWEPYFYNSTDAPGSTERNWYKNRLQDGHSLCSVDGKHAEFLDYPGSNYRLTSASSLIGGGVAINDPEIPEILKDKDGVSRPTTGAWDIGPYQYVTAGCSFGLTTTSASFNAAGGTGSFNITASDAGCAWSVIADAVWITVTSGLSGTGNSTVNYSVAANSGQARTGTIIVGGQMFTVSQSGAVACSFALTITSASFNAAGGTGSVNVTGSSNDCPWTAVSNNGWITVTSGGVGNGSGSVEYLVGQNTGSNRTGTITIAGTTFTIYQAAATPPRIAVSPSSIDFGYVRRGTSKSGTVTVSNTGGRLLAITSVSITGSNRSDFAQTSNCSSVGPGNSCSIIVTFTPSRSSTRTATLSIYSNDPFAPRKSVSLRGRGY